MEVTPKFQHAFERPEESTEPNPWFRSVVLEPSSLK
jgi:hypothetical protein